MWCRHCHQDVAAISRSGDAHKVCPCCNNTLIGNAQPGSVSPSVAHAADKPAKPAEPTTPLAARLPVRLYSPSREEDLSPRVDRESPIGGGREQQEQQEKQDRVSPQFNVVSADEPDEPAELHGPNHGAADAESNGVSADPPWDWLADRQFEDDLCQIQLLVRRTRLLSRPEAKSTMFAEVEQTSAKRESAHRTSEPRRVDETVVNAVNVGNAADSHNALSSRPLTEFLLWLGNVVGFGTLVCGLVLIGWGFFESRPSLWNLGVPLAVGGQIAIVLAMVTRLQTTAKDVEAQVAERRSEKRRETRHAA